MSFLERIDESIRRSTLWRSIFRQPYPNDERSRAMAVMNNVFLHIHPVRVQAGRFLADIKRWLESVDDQTSIG